MDHSFLVMLTVLAIASYGAGRFWALTVAGQEIPFNSHPHDHGLIVTLVSVATALFAYIALILLLPAITAWMAIGLGIAAAAWLLFQIGPEFRARKLFDWLIGWLLMAASAAIVIIAVGTGLSAISDNLHYAQ